VTATETESLPLAETLAALKEVIVGQERLLERLLVCLLAGGHCLVEGAPGLAKTLAASTLARTVGGSFARIQFTPDLLPSDIVGTRIWRPSTESFEVEPGPVLANVVLADEINRAPAKVQSALLEVMAERQVTIAGQRFAAPSPFLVLATQNPIESDGVYSLPEAQRDRFLMRVLVDYPSAEDEALIVRRRGSTGAAYDVRQTLPIRRVEELQRRAGAVEVPPHVLEYALRLVLASRNPIAHGLPELAGLIAWGAGPRATLGLIAAGRALALLRGRQVVAVQDVYEIAYDVLNHRLVPTYEALADGRTPERITVDLVARVAAPQEDLDCGPSRNASRAVEA
jgi:MoxR-like ATPase